MSGARNRLLSELKAVQQLNWLRVEAPEDNLFVWRIALVIVNPDSDYAGGYFTGELRFPTDYPYKPPSFRFTTPIFHPNIYNNGNICISILHSPGDDVMSGEQAGERWSPLQGVESVMLSILLLLDNPEINSPANVDASVCYRDDKASYRARAKQAVETSRHAMPADFVMPTKFDDDAAAKNKPGHDVEEDNAFWADSDEGDFDFGSDDSDEEQEFDEDFEDDEEEHQAKGKP
ncbi:ubiquitin conjugating enzyme [Ophiostoma piceae UAMH 11346]|uniref:Ubiquitin-conjugating enzyme E2 2 n=1 Tax=Ophiostoma piceae (strain UAMH 11346) TaxID=1262450 RepID=S3CX17_OPHP1|nr:ubiquitin conjugating enzyme [Ophiostoma piceae UAMH 11346]